jgi:hypothetical protein
MTFRPQSHDYRLCHFAKAILFLQPLENFFLWLSNTFADIGEPLHFSELMSEQQKAGGGAP